MFFLRKKKPVHTITERLIWGKVFGFLVGAICFLSLPSLSPEMSLFTGFGVWLWYTLFGGIIALLCIFEKHPIFKFRLYPLLRGFSVGAGLNLVLGFLIYNDIAVAFSFLQAPFEVMVFGPLLLIMVEGGLWGMILDFVLTKWLGEGKDLLKKL